jgi:phage terminase large subunit-like protein
MLLPAEISARLTPGFLNSLGETEKTELLDLLEERQRVLNETKLFQLYPDTGPLRRELYAKHLAFFRAGVDRMERAAIAANRVGKTWGIGGYETTLHLTGDYPEWWDGRRFTHPIDAWAAGDTSETTRDIVQHALMGPLGELGTGLIPAASIIGEPTKRMGVAGAMDTARIRHKSGGVSLIGFKSYDQGRKKFQGTAKHVVWLDEEPPEDVYDECLVRLMTLSGLMLCTFTPLLGLSKVALRFLPEMAPEAA